MKNKIITIILVIILIGGIASLSYPLISNMLRDRRQDQILSEFNQEMEAVPSNEIENARMTAQAYNEQLLGTVIISDPFDPKKKEQADDEYFEILNLDKNGIIGYVEIPRIDVYEPIYHGTSETVLAKGVGHLRNTSFPIGGTGTHAVLSGHTGLPEAEIFTNLTALKKDDIFFVHILKETLAYQVDQIKVVEPSDTRDLHIDTEQDYVTLVTCTPYGINSHRLLVRGRRVEYTPEVAEQAHQQKNEGGGNENWKEIYGKAIIKGLLIAAFILTVIVIILHFKKVRENREY